MISNHPNIPLWQALKPWKISSAQLECRVSICELIGRQATDEEIKLMADKCSSGGSATTGNLKVLHRDDMKNIYRMANR